MRAGFRRWTWALPVAALLLSTGAFSLLREPGELFSVTWLSTWIWLIPWLLLADRLRRKELFQGPRDHLRTWVPLLILAAALILLLFSSAVSHKWFFFLKWAPPDRHSVVGLPYRLALFVLLTGFMIPFLLTRRRRLHWILLGVLLAAQVACFQGLMRASGGRALARDDHPSMMFRLWEICQTWPQLMNYSPYWNGGVVDFVGTTTGLNGLGLLFRPLIALGEVQDLYTPMIGAAFIGIVPLLAAFSVRVAGGRGAAVWAAGLLGLGTSQKFFLWLLQYGTVGACFSTAFVLPFAACVFRALWLDRREWWLLVAMVLSFAFLFMWPPGALMALAVLLAAVANVRRWTWMRIGYLALCGLLGLAAISKPLGLLLTHAVADLTRPLALPAEAGAEAARTATDFWVAGWKNLVAEVKEIHPVVSVLGILGAIVFPCRSVRWWFVPIFAALAGLCGWGPLLRPHLELHRMSIALAIVAIAPASLAVERVLRTGHVRLALVRSALVALLILTGWNVRDLYAGRQTLFSLRYMGGATQSLVDLIRDNAVPGSRVLFAGPCVHGYGDGGHVALLPYLTGLEMMACDYYHFPMSEVEYEYPPMPFRDNPDRLFDFMRDYNVSLIITSSQPRYRVGVPWMSRLLAEPDRYRKIASFDDGQYAVFRVAGEFFPMALKGDGRADAAFNRIHVVTRRPEEHTVIKYNWQAGLKVKPPVRIRPFRIADACDLIEIIWNGRSDCTLEYDNGW